MICADIYEVFEIIKLLSRFTKRLIYELQTYKLRIYKLVYNFEYINNKCICTHSRLYLYIGNNVDTLKSIINNQTRLSILRMNL